MPIYDVNYEGVVENILPKQYRLTKFKAFLNSLIYPIQFLRDYFFNYYIGSSSTFFYVAYPSLFIPDKYTICRLTDNSVWMTLIDNVDATLYNPLLNQVSSGSTLIWSKLSDDYIGFNERTYFNNQKIMFENLLNRYFKNDTGPYYIYIINNDTTQPMFEIGQYSDETAVITQNDYDALFFISETDDENEEYNFTIYVPNAIVAFMSSEWIAEIREIADRYNFYSLIYNVVEY